MKVLEIKNNLVKISYNVKDNLALADFLIIEDSNMPYVAQVMNIKSESDYNSAIVKLLFTFNEEGILKNYNGTIPSTESTVSKLPAAELLDVIPKETPLFIGRIAQKNTNLFVDKSILENNLLICSNNFSNTSKLVTTIAEQVNEKIVILDPDGQFDLESRFEIGKDFKLPLNTDAVEYIYENDLEDIDSVNKAVIQDILIEVQNYIKTLPENFLPFETFISVIDSQYNQTKIEGLILLKNKLLKYKDNGIFAQNLKEALSLNILLEQNKTPIFDLSMISDNLKKYFTSHIYTILNKINETIYVFAKTNSSIITKKLLKRFLAKDNVFTTIICPHELKYIEDTKENSQNVIFFRPLTVMHDFASYNSYLNKLNEDEFVIYGAHTQNIPLIAELSEYSEDKEDKEDKEVKNEVNIFEQKDEFDNFDDFEDENLEESNEEIITQDNNSELTEFLDDSENISKEFKEEIKETSPEEIIEEAEPVEIIEDNSSDNTPEIIEEIQPVDNLLADIEDNSDDVIFESLEDDSNIDTNEEEEIENDELVEQVAKDVDKAFYEKLPEDDEISSDEDLTEEDLNILDDLSFDEIPLAGDDVTETTPEVEYEENPPVVPIYPAEDIEEKDNLTFEPGDHVSTAKYGEGVVEKMIKYGNKMLCSIDFPSIGRRLLDPAMTEITRINS